MRTFLRLLTVGVLFGVVATGAASAAQSTPVLTPTFSISVTGIPTSVARGELVTAHVAITNLTAVDATAKGTLTIAPPKVTAMSGPISRPFSVLVPANQTVTKDVTFRVPLSALPGTYTLTASVLGGAAPAVVTLAVT